MGHDSYQPNISVTPDQITPLYDWLLVRQLAEDRYVGLVVPSAYVQGRGGQWIKKAHSGPRRGEVLAVGRGEKRIEDLCFPMGHSVGRFRDCSVRLPLAVGVGDVILYPRFESSHVVINGEQLTFVREGDVMAVLDE